MVHWHYIGFFDPRDPIDLSVRPCPPKPIRPLPAEVVTRLREKHGFAGEEVFDCGGYLLSHLGGFGQLHPFESDLVAQGGVVLSEMGAVVQPPEAVRLYYQSIDERDGFASDSVR